MKLRISPDLELPPDAVTQTFGILAKRGSGKTYTAKVFAEELLKAALQVVVVDPVGVWWGLRVSANGKKEGLSILVMGGEHGDLPLERTAGEVVAQMVVEEQRSVVLDLATFRKNERTEFMTEFLETLYRLNRAPLQLIVDEADSMAPQKPFPGEQRLLGAMEDIVRRGRSRGIGCTLITQRPAVLNKNVLTQIEVLVCLRLIAPQDRAALEAWVEVHGTREERDELLASLPALPVGTAWFWSPAAGIFQRVRVRELETFDSSATPTAGAKIATPKKLAPVDLEALREKMAATIEEAKGKDPRELKKRIEELQGELEELRARPAAAPAELMNEEQFESLRIFGEAMRREFGEMAGKLDQVLALGPTAPSAMYANMQNGTPSRKSAGQPRPAPVTPARAGAEGRAVTGSTVRASGGGMPPRHQAILDALASFEAMRLASVTKEQLAVFCERPSTSGGWRNDLGELRQKGLIDYPAAGRVQLTSDGRGLASSGLRFRGQSELQEAWYRKLQPRLAQILLRLVSVYPNATTKQSLASTLDRPATSGGYRNDLGTLRTLGLIDYPQSGHVAATALLFPPLPR